MERKTNVTSAAAKRLGGQPENDQDARAAGLPSATAKSEAKKPTKQSLAPATGSTAQRLKTVRRPIQTTLGQ
jgi:hypothetical protein